MEATYFLEDNINAQESQLDIFQDEDLTDLLSDVSSHPLILRWFDCLGETSPSHSLQDIPANGILGHGELDSVFTDCKNFISEGNVQLFGYNLDESSLTHEQLTLLFQMARKNFMTMESYAVTINSTLGQSIKIEKVNFSQCREQICFLFCFLRYYINSIKTEYKWIADQAVPQILKHLQSWTLLTQNFSNLPQFIITNSSSRLGNKCSLASHHLFHIHLESRWYYLTLMWSICNPGVSCKDEACIALEEGLSRCIGELLVVAQACFIKHCAVTEKGRLIKNTPFPCTCVRELWLLLQLFADKLHHKGTISQTFWGILEHQLGKILSNQKILAANENCSLLREVDVCSVSNDFDRPCFCLWIFFHVARLYGYNENGLLCNQLRGLPSVDAVNLLESVLKKALPVDEVEEIRLREVLHVLQLLPSWWPTGTTPLLVLWEVFHRRLNSTFLLPGATPDMMAIVSKNVSGMVHQVKHYLKRDEHCSNENSYEMFLHLIGHQMQTSWSEPVLGKRAWNQLKGRIYPKFPPVRMQALSELGLYHLSSLFLTLALATDFQEVSGKLQELLESLPKSKNSEHSKNSVIWRSYLAILHVCSERGLDLAQAAAPLMSQLDSKCNKMTQFSSEDIALLRIYIDSLHDIVEIAPNLNISLHSLIGPWLMKYLAICSLMDACRVLNAVLALTSKLQNFHNLTKEIHGEQSIWSCLRNNLLPYLKQQSVLPNPAYQVADLAVAFTLSADDSLFVQLFSQFVTNELTNARVTARYLTHILPNDAATERLKLKIDRCEIQIIQAWVRCWMLVADGQSEINDLTRAVVQLPLLTSICGESVTILSDSLDPLEALMQISCSKLKSTQILREKQTLKEQLSLCLGRIDRIAELSLKSGKLSPKSVQRLYYSAGFMINLCAPLLYVKSQSSCALVSLVSQLLLPLSVYNIDNKLMPDVQTALLKTLPMFIKGLSSLSLRQDAYIGRTIRDLVIQYLPRFALSQGGTRHPLLECFDTSENLSAFILESISSNFLKCRGRNPHANVHQALKLLNELIQEHRKEAEIVNLLVEKVVQSLMELLLQLEEGMIKQQVLDTLQVILRTSAFRVSTDIREKFTLQLAMLYRSRLAFSAKPLFGLLDSLVRINPNLVAPSIEHLRSELAQVERLRGVGRDPVLRNALSAIEGKLGEI